MIVPRRLSLNQLLKKETSNFGSALKKNCDTLNLVSRALQLNCVLLSSAKFKVKNSTSIFLN